MSDGKVVEDVLETFIPVVESRRLPPQDIRFPKEGIALCLSGGGYRAMLFHCGTLWRLNEIGYLSQLRQISSVSGGSITAGMLGLRWDALAFDAAGVAQALRQEVIEPIRRLAGITIDIPAVVFGILGPGMAGRAIAAAYRRHLFGRASLQDLPQTPLFVINASNLQSGALWRFTRAFMADYRVGLIRSPQLSLATAVAASSAFPPFLSPIKLRLSEGAYEPLRPGEEEVTDLHYSPYTTNVTLTDGGVYDNLGLETAWKNWSTILVSDGGQKMEAQGRPWSLWPIQMLRILNLIDNQVRSRRKVQVLESFRQSRFFSQEGDLEGHDLYALTTRRGAYWHMGADLSDYNFGNTIRCPDQATAKLANIKTRLRKLDPATQERLINWGYAACDAQMRLWIDPTLPPPAFPYPRGVE